MASVCQSLDCSTALLQCPDRLRLHSSSAWKHGNAGPPFSSRSNCALAARALGIPPGRQQWRAMNVAVLEGDGYGGHAVTEGNLYPSQEPRISSQRKSSLVSGGISGELGSKDMRRDVVLNEAAPPVSGVFDGASSMNRERGGSILEEGAAFVRNRVERKAAAVKQALVSIEEAVMPTPFAPAEGDDAAFFIVISLFLAALFWVGNYAAPTWIFSDTVFRNSQQQRSQNNGDAQGDEEDAARAPAADADSPPGRRAAAAKAQPEGRVGDPDPADLIELPKNFMPFRDAAVLGFKAGRQKARDAEERAKAKREKTKKKG